MKYVPLTKGFFAIVDDEDFEEISKYKWYASQHGKTWYAKRSTNLDGKRTSIYMHRQIFGNPELTVDHTNCNTLDNRRLNLRCCSMAENIRNRKPYNKHSPYKGVFPKRAKWQAKITINGTVHYLGVFPSEEEAAAAYDNSAIIHHGTFARLNFEK